MKYCVLIIDGASGWPLPERGGKTCLELAQTPNLDAMAQEGTLGLIRTVPPGMEPSSACACMSVLGYDPKVYYRGRAAIEARSMGIPIDSSEVVFRSNLVAVRDGRMWSYSSGHISTDEARQLISALNESLGSDRVHFYPGVSYRHLLKLKGREDTLLASCTPPHDIPDKPISEYLPRGQGSGILKELMLEASRAPAPPGACRYIPLFFKTSDPSSLRGPFPMIIFTAFFRRAGSAQSILEEVVGPAEIILPSLSTGPQ